MAMNASQYHFGLIKDCEILAIVCYTESALKTPECSKNKEKLVFKSFSEWIALLSPRGCQLNSAQPPTKCSSSAFSLYYCIL